MNNPQALRMPSMQQSSNTASSGSVPPNGAFFGGMPQPNNAQPNNMRPNGMMPGGVSPNNASSNSGMPLMQQQMQAAPAPKKDITGLIKTIAIIILALLAATFIGLFIWMNSQYTEAKSDVDGKISRERAAAKDEQAMLDETEFLEREKYPYNTFSGPVDYGQLTFEYPKTWSVYIEKAATSVEGGDFKAYLNPGQVEPVSDETLNALRVSIMNTDIANVTEEYKKEMDKKGSTLKMTSVTIGANNNITADRYTGTIPDTEFSGIIVVFKIRDKTAILQTDSETYFKAEFDKLLETVTFNE